MQSETQSQLNPPASNPLARFIKQEKTYQVQYQIMLTMLELTRVQKLDETVLPNFTSLYCNLSPLIQSTLAFQYLNYRIWNNEQFPIAVREKTRFFKIVSEWILQYELKYNDLKGVKSQVLFLKQFFQKQTTNMYERIVLIHQIHQDLIELFGKRFWKLNQNSEPKFKPPKEPTKQQAQQLLKFLSILVEYYQIFPSQSSSTVYTSQLYLIREHSSHYIEFILRSMQYILSVNASVTSVPDINTTNSPKLLKSHSCPKSIISAPTLSQSQSISPVKKSKQLYLQKHQQMQLTRLTLIFLQRPDIQDNKCINMIKLLMLRTSKMVRLAMVVDYVRYYDYLQRSNRYGILEQLQNLIYFRQLIIGQSQISPPTLTSNQFSKSLSMLQIPARSKCRLAVSHESQIFGKFSILQLQFFIQSDDINVTIFHMPRTNNTNINTKQKEYWRQDRTADRRVQIMLKEDGLYFIQFDNGYSWIKAKKIKYKIDLYCTGIQQLQLQNKIDPQKNNQVKQEKKMTKNEQSIKGINAQKIVNQQRLKISE